MYDSVARVVHLPVLNLVRLFAIFGPALAPVTNFLTSVALSSAHV